MESDFDLCQKFGNALRSLLPGFNMYDNEIEAVIDSKGVDYFVYQSGKEVADLIETALLLSRVGSRKEALNA